MSDNTPPIEVTQWIRDACKRHNDIPSVISEVMRRSAGKADAKQIEVLARTLLAIRQGKTPEHLVFDIKTHPLVQYCLAEKDKRIKELEQALSYILDQWWTPQIQEIFGGYAQDEINVLKVGNSVLRNEQPTGFITKSVPPVWTPHTELE